MPYIFECDEFVVQDLRSAISKIRGSGYPYNWTGCGIRHLTGPRRIDRYLVHQTDGNMLPGERGALSTAEFQTCNPSFQCPKCETVWEGTPRYPKATCPRCGVKGRDLCTGRGYPKMSYHVWVPYTPLRNEKGKFIIYQCVDFQETTQHTPGANDTGVSVAFQGKFFSRHMTARFVPWPETDGQPSKAQQAIWKGLATAWLRDTLQVGNRGVDGAFRYENPSGTGDWLENKILALRQEPVPEPAPDFTPGTQLPTWQDRQQALVEAGYNITVDGEPSDSTKWAIELFQADHKLLVTGQWDAETEQALKRPDLTIITEPEKRKRR